MKKSEESQVQQLMQSLLPDSKPPYDFDKEEVFVWEDTSGSLAGFASASIRPWVEGSTIEPCPHVEGWYVKPELRQQGIGKALIEAVEDWSRQQGFAELTSDVEISNYDSLNAHAALGFEPTSKIQYFKKKL